MHFIVKFCHFSRSYLGLLRWLSCKESSCRFRTCSLDPWVGKIPWRRKWQPSLVFLPGESRGQGSLAGYSPWGRKGLDTTEWLSTHAWPQVLVGEGGHTSLHLDLLHLSFFLHPPCWAQSWEVNRWAVSLLSRKSFSLKFSSDSHLPNPGDFS